MMSGRLFAFALALCCAGPALAQLSGDTILPPVEIRSKKNPGDVPYLSAYRLQQRLLSLLPPEPRVTDIRMRVMFTSLSPAEQDDFLPATWAVAVVGTALDQAIPVVRGGYFLLPELAIANDDDATLMFNTQSAKKTLSAVWSVRLGNGNVLPYRDFARAIGEFESVRAKIGREELAMRRLREHQLNALRACFVDRQGAILVDASASGALLRGSCWFLRFDPARGDATITFSGQLESLTLGLLDDKAARALPAPRLDHRPEIIDEIDPVQGKIRW